MPALPFHLLLRMDTFRFSKWCFGFIFPSFYFPKTSICISLLFSHPVMSDSLQLHSICQTSLSFTISQSLLKFMSMELVMPSNHLILCPPHLLLPLIFPSIRVFQMSQLLGSGGQSIGTSASVLPMNIQDWPPLGLTGLISLQSKGLSIVFSNTTVQKASVLGHSDFLMVQLSNPYMTTGKTIALTRWTFVSKVISLLFNMLSRLVIGLHRRSKRLLISWLQSPSAVIVEPEKRKSVTVYIVSPSICHEVMGPDAMIFVS